MAEQETGMVFIRGIVLWAILSLYGCLLVDGQSPERRYACWGSFGPPVVSAQCPRNTVIQVLRAGLKVQNHGGLCTYNENDCGCEYGQTGCQMQDVRQQCMGRPACRLDVTQQYINTASCKGFSDYMYIEFNCVPVEHNSVSEICSEVRTLSEHGFLRSPNYPSLARGGRECDCTLTTDDSSSIELTVLDIQTRAYKCDHDKLLVAYDGRTDTYCGQKRESTKKRIASKSSVVSVKYNTDGEGVGGSFWLKYEAQPKANVKLTCTYTETTTTKTTDTSIEMTTDFTEETKPTHRYYRPRTPEGTRREKVRSSKEKDKKKPWWWKFLENANKTKPTQEIAKPTTPSALVESLKALPSRTHQGVTLKSTSSSSANADHSYHHQQQKRYPTFVEANQASQKGKTQLGRRPVNSAPPHHVPTKSESLTKPESNTVTIIAACIVGSILVVIVLGIVIRFVVNRKHGRPPPQIIRSKRYRAPSTPENRFPGQRIPRPKRI